MTTSAAKAHESRLIQKLELAIARSVHPAEQACLRVERAGHLARQGHFDAAQAELNAVHAQFDRQPHAAVSAWLCIAEAWFAYFTNLSGSARDKMHRALALSTAARLPQLQALSAAWLAHMDYVAQDFPRMAAHVRLAFELAAADNHSARARAALVVAQALQFAGRPEQAQAWFASAREHAAAEGDEATLTALTHNLAWTQGLQTLQARIMEGLEASASEQAARQAMLGAQAAANLDRWIGTLSLDALLPMLRATVHSARNEHAAALALYRENWLAAQRQGLGRMTAHVLADMAWCASQCGEQEAAQRAAREAELALDPSMHPDDLATAHQRLGQWHVLAGQVGLAQPHFDAARVAWARHTALQAQVLSQLEFLSPGVLGCTSPKPKIQVPQA